MKSKKRMSRRVMKLLGKCGRRVEVSFSQERREESSKFSRDSLFERWDRNSTGGLGKTFGRSEGWL
jgi:hypothetical protein